MRGPSNAMDVEPASRRARSRSLLGIGLIILAALGLVAVGWFAAYQFRSPAQRAADASAPQQGPIFTRIRFGQLSDQVSGSGTVTFSRTQQVAPTEVPGYAVVTAKTVPAGRQVRDCGVLSQVNGQPIFVMPGRFPFYRDLEPGLRGPDVLQLNRALDACHPAAGLRGEVFGPATATAVRRLYSDAGYAPRASLPLTDVVVVDSLPATVVRTPEIGTAVPPDAALATLGTGHVEVQIALAAASAARLSDGTSASLSVTGMSSAVPGRVRSVGTRSDAQGLVMIRLTPQSALPASALARQVVATLTIRTIGAHSAIVPDRAVVMSERGVGSVRVRHADGGATMTVAVRVLGSLQGDSVVSAVRAGQLRPGDSVQVR